MLRTGPSRRARRARVAVVKNGVVLSVALGLGPVQAIGSITELLMATGRSPDFQEAVEAWLDMFREDETLGSKS